MVRGHPSSTGYHWICLVGSTGQYYLGAKPFFWWSFFGGAPCKHGLFFFMPQKLARCGEDRVQSKQLLPSSLHACMHTFLVSLFGLDAHMVYFSFCFLLISLCSLDLPYFIRMLSVHGIMACCSNEYVCGIVCLYVFIHRYTQRHTHKNTSVIYTTVYLIDS